jgi:hypothetical protein
MISLVENIDIEVVIVKTFLASVWGFVDYEREKC